MHDVIVIGGGPVGMLAAGRLHRAGLDVVVLERRAEAAPGSRAIGIHAPVLAALESSGLTERLLDGALRVDRGEARSGGRLLGTVRFDRLPTRFPFVATLPQSATEAALAADAPEVRRSVAVTSVRNDGDRVRVETDGEALLARVAIVAAGTRARDLVYRPGALRVRRYPDQYLMADLAAPGGPVAVVHLDGGGVLESFPLPDGRRRFVAWDASPTDDAPDARTERMRVALDQRGERTAAAGLELATAFRVRRVVAPSLVRGGVIVIGDTAHEVSPIGGQGMNLGLLDAATLAPVVAAWLRSGRRPDAELARWERDRITSARTAARLATMNTALGRPLGQTADAWRRAVLGGVLRSPAGGVLAKAYAMGFDRAA
ncbi:FAD-dependent oxidoreductase [Arenivirga flava]|uniref:Oxidoreductase n=1 Tax=Arenivirga flava TaxID=1930060 RepID=A0AA37UVS7_9MICO|nr:NAD(P)/FAD-dependent oxidoreductase [Arenivirga flava]GMA29557.1 oxidoreductase [Arenivirga flava]